MSGNVGAVVKPAVVVPYVLNPPGVVPILYVVTPATTGAEVPVKVVDVPLHIEAFAAVNVTVGTG